MQVQVAHSASPFQSKNPARHKVVRKASILSSSDGVIWRASRLTDARDLTLDRFASQITHYAKGCGRAIFLRDSALIVGLHRSMLVSFHVARRCLSGDRAVQGVSGSSFALFTCIDRTAALTGVTQPDVRHLSSITACQRCSVYAGPHKQWFHNSTHKHCMHHLQGHSGCHKSHCTGMVTHFDCFSSNARAYS
jgi:hypothetical protein